MADYKILQNIDLAQNEIKEVSKIANDREDGKDKGLRIQTGDNTSLAFNRKIGDTANFIKGTVKDGTKESTLNIEPSKVSISNTKGTTSLSSFVLGLDSKGNEHIEAVSPLVDIKTGSTDYTDPHISLKKDASNSTLRLQSNTVGIRSKGDTESSLTMNGGITGVSNDIFLGDSEDTDTKKVSLNLKTNGTISESASKSITETVDKLSLTLEKTDSSQSITLKNEKELDNSKIEVLDSNVKISKGSDSYINIESGTQSDFIEEQSNKVIIKTPSNNVTLTLNESDNLASLESNKGKITLTSLNGAKTEYGKNTITTEADDITIKAKGYTETEATKYYPHIELKSTTDTNSVLLEGKTINISSKDEDSNIEDIITLSGSKLNVESTTTEITSDTINIGKDGKILSIDTTTSETTPKIAIPSNTETDINSEIIGLGDKGNNSTTTVDGSKFEVNTSETSITSTTTTTISSTTTIKSSPNSENTIEVKKESTSITGSQADINPANINIGTVDSSKVTIGKDNTNNTTTLKSSTTEITSSTLNIESNKVDFKGTNQNVTFKGKGNSSVTSEVPTYIKDTTFSVEKTTDSSEVFKVDTSSDNTSTTINGKTATINSDTVEIGTGTTNAINVGRNATGTITTLKSNTTKITSPTIEIGKESPSTSVSIGKKDSEVTLEGKSNFLIEASNTNSKVQANNLKFNTSLSSNDIKVYWDSTLNSLVFAKA